MVKGQVQQVLEGEGEEEEGDSGDEEGEEKQWFPQEE